MVVSAQSVTAGEKLFCVEPSSDDVLAFVLVLTIFDYPGGAAAAWRKSRPTSPASLQKGQA